MPLFRKHLMMEMLDEYSASPRTVAGEKQLAFLFGLIAHQEADVPWHAGLNDCTTEPGKTPWLGPVCLTGDIDQVAHPKMELGVDQTVYNYDGGAWTFLSFGLIDRKRRVEFDYVYTATPVVLAASSAAGIGEPTCPDPDLLGCIDDGGAILHGHGEQRALWAVLVPRNNYPHGRYERMIMDYVPGGIQNGAALTAAAWMHAWDEMMAPSVASITRAGDSPKNGEDVAFEVTFSEAVSGVDAGDFAPMTTGTLSDATVRSVACVGASGMVTSCMVTVAMGPGNGTVRLDVPRGASATDELGSGLLALPYVSGEAYTIDWAPPPPPPPPEPEDPTPEPPTRDDPDDPTPEPPTPPDPNESTASPEADVPRTLACLRINFEFARDAARRGTYVVQEVGGRVLATWWAEEGWKDSGWVRDLNISFPAVHVQVFWVKGDGSPPVEMTILNPAPGMTYGWLARGQCHALEVDWPE